jgi:hypothetical protein
MKDDKKKGTTVFRVLSAKYPEEDCINVPEY